MNSANILLVIPCYRDGAKLAGYLPDLCAKLAGGLDGVAVQIVDDGSPPNEQALLANAIERERCAHDFVRPLIAHGVNRGKGHAIRTGWTSGPRAPWLAFVDADGAVPADAVVALLKRSQQSPGPAVYVGDRTVRTGPVVRRFWYRRLGSRVFNVWVRLCLGLELADTQCGLKVIPASLHHQHPWREDGFAIDLELLLRARSLGLPIITQAIGWHEKPDSSFGARAMAGLFVAVWRLRRQRGS